MTSSFNEPPPLVLVEGFLSAGGDIVWGDFSRYMNDFGRNANFGRRRGIFVSIGPVSSLHDRACELFYALKGGQVNYGKAHAKQNNHEQFGRSHIKGLYPGWSASQPLHFLGHSMGGPTLIKLQHLLQTGFFGPEYGPDMILSLNSVQSPFRGSPVVHALGYYTPGVPNAPKLTVGSLIENSAHILAYLAPAIPIQALDMHADARKLSFTECSFGDLLKQLQHSDWARGKDVGPYDASLQAADERELVGEGAPHPRTFYRSWSSSITTRQSVYTGKHRPTYDMLLNPPLFYTSQFIGSFDYNSIKPAPNVVRDPTANTDDQLSSVVEDLGEQYYANDGVIPAFSQWHPFHCSSIRCHHFAGTGIRPDGQPGPAAPGEGHSIEPGMWYVHAVQGVSHVGMAPLWFGSSKQKTFWREMGEWLRAVDEHAPEVRGYAIKASAQPTDVQTVKITNPSGKPALVASYA